MKSNIKSVLFSSIIFSCLLLNGVISFAQGPNQNLHFRNCYQTIELGTGGTYNMLKGEGFQFNYQNYSGGLTWVNIKQFDVNGGGLFPDYGALWSGVFEKHYGVTAHAPGNPPIVYFLEAVELVNGQQFNTNELYFNNEVAYVEITLIFPDLDFEFITSGPTVTVHFKDLEDAIGLFDNNNATCQSFDNFNIGYDLDLDGFCGMIEASINVHPDDIIDPNDPDNSQPYPLGWTAVLNNFNDHCDECYNIGVDYNIPHPVPCGCKLFQLEVTLRPCFQFIEFGCQEISYVKDVWICCSCDIRPDPPEI